MRSSFVTGNSVRQERSPVFANHVFLTNTRPCIQSLNMPSSVKVLIKVTMGDDFAAAPALPDISLLFVELFCGVLSKGRHEA